MTSYRYGKVSSTAETAGGVITLALIGAAICAWITHIIVAISAIVGGTSVSVSYGLLLIAGAFIPPVGVIHGFGVWFGLW